MRGGMNQLMRQAQKMQGEIARVQEEFGERRVEAASGGGMVVAVVNGNQELLELEIKPEVLADGDVELMEEMIVAAVNEAMRAASEQLNHEIEKITGGFNIPGLF